MMNEGQMIVTTSSSGVGGGGGGVGGVVVSAASLQQQQQQQQQPATQQMVGLSGVVGHSNSVVQANNVPSSIMTSNSMASLNGAPGNTITTTINSFASPLTTPTTMVTQSPINPQPTSMHQAMVHPNVPQSPIPQMQVIQQPLHSPTYLPHMFGTQQQVLVPSNLSNITMSPSIQVIAAGKTCVPNQITTQMLAGKQMIQSQSNYLPSPGNQTLVIGQLMPSQSSLVPQHTKQVADAHKVRPYVMSPASLQSKSPILPQQSQPQLLNASQFKQLTSQATIVSTPQLITSQAPGGAMIASQSQIINGLQAISTSLPPGITWATHGGLQSHVITAQNPIFIRSSQQQDMYIQSQHTAPTPIQPQPQTSMQSLMHQQSQQHLMKTKQLELAPIIHPKVSGGIVGGKTFTNILPSLPSSTPQRPASSVATQTNTLANLRPQLKQRAKGHLNRVAPAFSGNVPYHPKADAANQTKLFIAPQQTQMPIQSKMVSEVKMAAPVMTQHPAVGVFPEGINVMGMRMATANVMPMPISSPNTNGMMEAMDTSESMPNDPNAQMMSNVTVSSGLNIMPQTVSVNVTAMQANGGVKEVAQQTPSPNPTTVTVSVANTNQVMLPDNPQMLQQLLQPSVMAPEVHEVAVGTENGTKEKQPKAIVKPHVLNHLIEGFIIQESGDPFPVSRSNLSSEMSLPKQPLSSHMSNESMINTNPEVASSGNSPSPAGQPPKPQPSPQQQEQHSEQNEPWPDGGKYGKKKKHGPKMKKSMRKMERSRMSYNADEWVRTQAPIESPGKEEETNSSNSGAESSLSPVTPTNPKDMMELDPGPRKPPKKWSVQEVFEFIKALPGCADYAEDFRLQEIDGHALLLLKEDHLMTAMNMKLGPALKICAKITTLKEEMQRQ